MPDPDPCDQAADWQLLRRYADGGSQAAFAELVRRYVDFVYSMALRRTGRDSHLAQDITQAVFVLLARKAATLQRGVILSGWLHHGTRYVAANALKRESRRRRHERAAAAIPAKEPQMSIAPADRHDAAADWEVVAPLLETALDHLGASDRDAVLLRFIRGKSHRDVGQAMGISEDAARKRVDRALTRLRNFFTARGVNVPAVTVAALLGTRAVEAAPPALATSASAVAIAIPGGAAGASLANGAAVTMAWAKAKLVAACVAATVLLSTAAVLTVKHANKPDARPIAQTPATPPTLPAVPVMAPQTPTAPDANKPIEGTIFGIDAEPLPGAEVYLCTPTRPLNAVSPDRGRNPPAVTQSDGKFSFPPTHDALVLVAVFHPDGYAQVDAKELSSSPQIFIRPWARIEGVLLDGDKPLAGESVFVGSLLTSDNPQASCITHQRILKTDKDGRFAVERVAPIGVHLYRNTPHRPPLQNKWDYQLLEPGKTAKVQLGGAGRHALGRLLPPQGPVPGIPAAWKWQDDQTRIASELRVRYASAKRMTYPPGADKLSPQERRELEKAWKKTPEGVESQKYLFGEEYAVEPDGTFRLQDLRPGRYTLEATVRQEEPGRSSETIAAGHLDFEVPAPPQGHRIGEPVNVGEIKMRAGSRLIVGEPAPDFTVQSLDGRPITLADFRGKYVLIHLPASAMQPDDWIPFLKLHESFAADPQFTMLTVHLAQARLGAADLKANAQQRGVKWPQAMISSANIRPGPGGVDPAYRRGHGLCLIDPQGKVAAKLLRPHTADVEVAKLLLELR